MTRRFLSRIDVAMLAVFLVAVVLVMIFATLASVMEGDTLALDRQLLMAVRDPLHPTVPLGPRWLAIALTDITALGGFTCLTLLTVIIVGYLLMMRRRPTALFVVGAVVMGALGSKLLKTFFNRPRPGVVAHLVAVNSSSFPSGHAMNSAVVYMTLGALVARTESEDHVRIYIVGVAMALVLVIGA